MHELIVLLVIGVGTYTMRAAFLMTRGDRPPGLLATYLPHLAPAILAAIAVPALVAPEGTISITTTVPALAAAAATWGLWGLTRQLPTALIGGLALWWAVLALMPL